HLPRDGNVLRRAARRARGEGIVRNMLRPGHTLKARVGRSHVLVPELLVRPQRDALLIVGDGVDVEEVVVATEFRVASLVNEAHQLTALGANEVEPVELTDAHEGVAVEPGVGNAADDVAAGDPLDECGHGVPPTNPASPEIRQLARQSSARYATFSPRRR